ncbi:MAG: hypothetical protein KAH46_14075 [Mycobacterium sp.]|nr:hypothetical protein [Mycobacterium sp.]
MTARASLFDLLGDPATTSQFFDHVAEDVEWTVMGTHPLAGVYRSKQEFFDATFAVLNGIMTAGVALHVVAVHETDDHVIAELQASSTTVDGIPFDNRYCWVCRFVDETIVEVRAYLDSAMVAYATGRARATGSVDRTH